MQPLPDAAGRSLALNLHFYPDSVLRRRMPDVPELTGDIKAQAEAMIPFMIEEGGIGLAAPQIGWETRVLVASEDGSKELSHVLINPKITWKSKDQEWDEEGCLSIPGIYGEVRRHRAIKVEAWDLDGQLIEVEAEDLFARVIQHEIDHLEGTLFISRLRPADRALVKSALMDMKARYEDPDGSEGQ